MFLGDKYFCNELKVNELKILRNFCMIYELASSSMTISGYRKLL